METSPFSAAYRSLEEIAKQKIFNMLPEDLKKEYQLLLFLQEFDHDNWKIVKAADKICAYLKCLEEIKPGNKEFSQGEKTIKSEAGVRIIRDGNIIRD